MKYRVTYEDGSSRLVDGQNVVSWHHGDVAYIEREDVVRVSPREFAERVKQLATRDLDPEEELLASDYILALAEAVRELEESQCCEKHKHLPPNANWCDPQLDAAIKAYADDA